MFERIWIALRIKKRPAATANLAATRATASKLEQVTKSRRKGSGDDGLPVTQINSFGGSGGRRTSTRIEDSERDVPLAFRMHGGGDFSGGGASASWDDKPSTVACWGGGSATGGVGRERQRIKQQLQRLQRRRRHGEQSGVAQRLT